MLSALAIFSLAVQSASATRAALHGVPLGECYQCEVTCFEDCTLKFEREIMKDDMLLQLLDSPAKNVTDSNVQQSEGRPVVEFQDNHTVALRESYSKCLQESGCPCRAEAKVGKAIQLMDRKKKKTKCAAGMGSCSEQCSAKVIDNDILALSNEAQKAQQSDSEAKRSLLQKRKGFPLHPIKIGVFSKGKMTMDSCLKYCLASTCGCHDA